MPVRQGAGGKKSGKVFGRGKRQPRRSVPAHLLASPLKISRRSLCRPGFPATGLRRWGGESRHARVCRAPRLDDHHASEEVGSRATQMGVVNGDSQSGLQRFGDKLSLPANHPSFAVSALFAKSHPDFILVRADSPRATRVLAMISLRLRHTKSWSSAIKICMFHFSRRVECPRARGQ
jgi:hypothetical protein